MLMALGTIIPLSLDWQVNLELVILFTLIFMLAGAVYGIAYSLVIMAVHFKKFRQEFGSVFKKYKKGKIC